MTIFADYDVSGYGAFHLSVTYLLHIPLHGDWPMMMTVCRSVIKMIGFMDVVFMVTDGILPFLYIC